MTEAEAVGQQLPKHVGEHVTAERERYDQQFGARRQSDEDLLVPFGAEYQPNDLRAAKLYAFEQLGDLRGKRVLEIGAGTGWHAAMLVHRGAYVVATDVSPVGVDEARRRFAVNGMSDRAETAVVAAEKIDFPDASFDVVFGVAVLHHLEMDHAGPEIARVLARGGRAVFLEPMSENPVLDLARDYLPYPNKKSPLGHRGITYAMIRRLAPYFAAVQAQEFYLTSMLNRMFGQHTSITPLEALDRSLLQRFPSLRRFSRHVVVTLVKA